MSLFDQATNAASTPIVPQSRFIFECAELAEQPPYAPPGEAPKPGARPGIRWSFHLYDAVTREPFYFQDEIYTFWQSTTANMQRGARAREYAEALIGRELAEGESINPSDLLGKRGVGMVIWEFNKDKTKKNAKLVAVEPYREAVAATPARATASAATAVMERPSAASVSADASTADIDRALLISAVEKKIKQAERLQTKRHLDWLATDMSEFTVADLEEFKTAIQADIDAD